MLWCMVSKTQLPYIYLIMHMWNASRHQYQYAIPAMKWSFDAFLQWGFWRVVLAGFSFVNHAQFGAKEKMFLFIRMQNKVYSSIPTFPRKLPEKRKQFYEWVVHDVIHSGGSQRKGLILQHHKCELTWLQFNWGIRKQHWGPIGTAALPWNSFQFLPISSFFHQVWKTQLGTKGRLINFFALGQFDLWQSLS